MKYLALLVMGCLLLCAAPVHAATYAYIPNNSADTDSVTRVDSSGDPPVHETYSFTDDDAQNDPDPHGVAVTPDGFSIWVTLNGFDQVVRLTDSSFSDSSIIAVDLPADSKPRAVAIDTAGDYAYVANYGKNSVSKIDLGSNAVVGDPIAVGQGPWGVAAYFDETAGEHRVYVSNYDDGTVTVITDDDSTIATTYKIPEDDSTTLGDGPLGVALTPDGSRLYVALHNDDSVAVIRTSDNQVEGFINNVGDGPWGVAVGKEGAYVYVSNNLEDTVSVISTDTHQVTATFPVGPKPSGVAAPKYGDFAYVINQDSNFISKIDMGDESVSKIDIVDESVEEIGADEEIEGTALGAFIGGARPSAPGELTATETSYDTIELTWTDNATDELGFKIERRQSDEDEFTVIDDVPADTTTYSDDGLDNSTNYTYRIRAYNEVTESAYATEASATTEEGRFSWCYIGSLLR